MTEEATFSGCHFMEPTGLRATMRPFFVETVSHHAVLAKMAVVFL